MTYGNQVLPHGKFGLKQYFESLIFIYQAQLKNEKTIGKNLK